MKNFIQDKSSPYLSNPLMYTSIKNNINDSNELYRLRKPTEKSDINELKKDIDNILSNTTIKRACCLGDFNEDRTAYKINVRIPIPKGYDETKLSPIEKRFGYIEKYLEVPKNLCSYVRGSNNCDLFSKYYCANMRKFYAEEKNFLPSQWDYEGFYMFKPECACFNKISPNMESIPGISKSCYMPGCFPTSNVKTGIYNSGIGTCSGNICQQSIYLDNIYTEGDSAISAQMQAACGTNTQIDKIKNISTEQKNINENTFEKYKYYIYGGIALFFLLLIIIIK